LEARGFSFYRGARCCEGAGKVDGGAAFLDGEGARRWGRVLAGIMEVLNV
jgi:hypothetical protein